MSENPPPIPTKKKRTLFWLAILLPLLVIVLFTTQVYPALDDWWNTGNGQSLAPVDLNEITARFDPPTAAYYHKLEAEALNEYWKKNWWQIRSYSEGKAAIRIFLCGQVGGDPYGEGLLQKATLYAHRAYDRGSRDPLIRTICDVFHYQNHYTGNNASATELTERCMATIHSNYPALGKMAELTYTAKSLAVASADPNISPRMHPALAKLPELCTLEGTTFESLIASNPTDAILFRVADTAMDTLEDSPEAVKRAGEGITQAFEKQKREGAIRALCQGDFYFTWAWSARGSGWADTVTQLGWQLMKDRLQKAREILTDAATAYPNNPMIPTLLIGIELGDGGNTRRMEEYFRQATTIDPNFRRAYERKMYFLQPRWYGSARDVLEFGLKCVQTDRWEAGIPLVFVNGIKLVAEQDNRVYQVPQIWTAVSKTYEGFLKRYPNSIINRTKYLQAAVEARQWKTAKLQIVALGDDWDRQVYSDEDYAKLRADISANR